jgi:hypothetical protein
VGCNPTSAKRPGQVTYSEEKTDSGRRLVVPRAGLCRDAPDCGKKVDVGLITV